MTTQCLETFDTVRLLDLAEKVLASDWTYCHGTMYAKGDLTGILTFCNDHYEMRAA